MRSNRRESGHAHAAAFGEARGGQGVVELVGILGYYALVSMTLNVFGIEVPIGTIPPFPEPRT